jgi:hypothetical protein
MLHFLAVLSCPNKLSKNKMYDNRRDRDRDRNKDNYRPKDKDRDRDRERERHQIFFKMTSKVPKIFEK